jgi:subtilisin family serine protease
MARQRQAREKPMETFVHPQAGRVRRDATRLAIRWRDEAAEAAKASLLEDQTLVLATVSDEDRPPTISVNQTSHLSWVRRQAGGAISATTEKTIEQSELVDWIARAYRVEDAEDPYAALFAVNPTRVYVAQQPLEAAGGVGQLGVSVSVDADRARRIPSLVALAVESPSVAEGRSAIEVAVQLAETMPGAVRLENIPYLSPATRTATAPCAPPMTEFQPDDPEFPDQWGVERIGVPRAWELVRGDPGVVVAVIDEGVELAHPDLSVYPQSWNASTDTPNGGPTGNHGTACAGIIGARLDNALGVAGVAGGVQVMAIATATWADVDIAEGLYFAADNGARIVSMSFGVYPSWGFWDFDLIRDALQYAQDKGLLLVAASGNEDWNQSRFPGSDARTLCVGGSNRSDERKRIGDASSENWWGASYGPDVDVVAPCLEIPTTDRLGGAGYDATDYYDRFNGTSSATPHVAGLAGLLLSLRPSLTNVQLRQIIESTCDKISPNLYAYANVGTKPSGTWNEEVGYGRVNAERALLAACAFDDGRRGTCSGCGGECLESTPHECRSPAPIPWLPYDRCQFFYEARIFTPERVQERLALRITYEHCLRIVGRQQGPLIYTLTLLPGEEVALYEYDRYRRVRSETERVSVQTSFRQTLSALSQTRRSASASAYVETLSAARTRADTSVSAGGGLAGFFGAPSVRGEFSTELETTVASGASVRTASEQFTQNAITASQSTEAERSVVVSRFEDAEHRAATSRRFRNDNHCHAVTYFVRRVNEVYEAHTRVESLEWRLGEGAPWRSVDDLEGLPDDLRKRFERFLHDVPRAGEERRDRRSITLPTDGTLYEAELAHCSSCEPEREAEVLIGIELQRLESRRRCLEVELLALELERRRALASSGAAEPLALNEWTYSDVPGATVMAMSESGGEEVSTRSG